MGKTRDHLFPTMCTAGQTYGTLCFAADINTYCTQDRIEIGKKRVSEQCICDTAPPGDTADVVQFI